MSNQFTLTHDDGSAKVEYTFSAVDLDTVLENVDRFIRAAGFVPKGELVYLEEEKAEEEPLKLVGLEELLSDEEYNELDHDDI
jgi:hypothetical protein